MPRYFKTKADQDATLKMPLPQLISLWIVCTLTIWALASLSVTTYTEYASPLLTTSFGATTIILFAIPNSPFSRARSAIGGHILSAFVGMTVFTFLGGNPFTAGFAVATALLVMILTDTLHPPSGATALNVIIGGSIIQDLGYSYIIFPATIGPIFLFIIAKIYHRIIKQFSK